MLVQVLEAPPQQLLGLSHVHQEDLLLKQRPQRWEAREKVAVMLHAVDQAVGAVPAQLRRPGRCAQIELDDCS